MLDSEVMEGALEWGKEIEQEMLLMQRAQRSEGNIDLGRYQGLAAVNTMLVAIAATMNSLIRGHNRPEKGG